MTFVRFAAGAAAVALCAAASAADVAVFPPQAVNLTPEQAEAIGTVLGQTYAHVSGAEVIPPRQAATAVTSPHQLAGAAARLGVREYIEIGAVGLFSPGSQDPDSRIVIQASRRTQDGDLVYRAELTATSMGDVEVVAERLARALHEKRPPEATRDVHTVTRKEATGENRTFTEKVVGIKSAVSWPMARSADFEPVVSLGFDGRFEGRNYFLEFGVGSALPASFDIDPPSRGYGLLYTEIGASYYLTSTSVSPYVGLGVSPRIVFTSGGGVNVAGYGQIGLMFMRDSSTRLYAEARVTQNALPIRIHDDTAVGSPRIKIYPTEVGAQVGIGW